MRRLGCVLLAVLMASVGRASPTFAAKPLGPLRVGGIVDAELFPGAEIGARARFDAVNATGGVDGRRVEFVGVSDDRRDPSVTRSEIHRLTRDAGVDAVVPVVTSRFTDDGMLAAARVPAFGWGIAGGFCGNRWAFAITGCLAPLLPHRVPGIWGDLVASVLRARKVPHPTAAIVVETAAVPRSLDELRSVVEAAGIQVVYAKAALGTGPDAASGVDATATEILTAARRPPSAVFVVGGFGAVGALQGALRLHGYDGVMTNLVQYSPILVGPAQGAYVLTQFATPESAPANPAMREIVRQISALTSDPVTPSMLAGWLAADLWVRAAAAAGPQPTPSRVAIFLTGLKTGAAEQRGIFVGFEIAQAHDDRLGMKRRGDGADTLGETADEVGAAIRRASRQPVNVPLLVRPELVVFQQRARVHLDAVIDDELQARQPHTVIRQEGIFKGLIGIAHIHHDFRARPVRRIQRNALDAEFLCALVDLSGIALGATHRHAHAAADDLGGVATTHDGWNAQLARDDGGMTGASAAVGDDGGGGFHYRFPVGIGHVCHQHLAGAQFRHIGCGLDHVRCAARDTAANAFPGGQDLAARFQRINLVHVARLARTHGLGARLQDIEFPVHAVLGPFDVHRSILARELRIMPFDLHGIPRQLQCFIVRQ